MVKIHHGKADMPFPREIRNRQETERDDKPGPNPVLKPVSSQEVQSNLQGFRRQS
jgi:hypothetical protein